MAFQETTQAVVGYETNMMGFGEQSLMAAKGKESSVSGIRKSIGKFVSEIESKAKDLRKKSAEAAGTSVALMGLSAAFRVVSERLSETAITFDDLALKIREVEATFIEVERLLAAVENGSSTALQELSNLTSQVQKITN